ncbi:hypothetical protein MPL1032_180043 [Mesorhizobium plurifarium]|uniref:Transposase n=1 Tax=Mesorhizobium plurifarium TaxID=69974 RepID=A0A0K2VTC2_MESPL|nr:hypothetical protein MPL1032_180043 [Mesorhizobium plurifarium]
MFAESPGTGEIETQLSTFGGILQVDDYAAYKNLGRCCIPLSWHVATSNLKANRCVRALLGIAK